jgi:asparagine synthase (glutamine-hydrolysing)
VGIGPSRNAVEWGIRPTAEERTVCGIAGVFGPREGAREQLLRETVEGMTATIRHRGPDDNGIWVDPTAGVGLGSRRLAVIDLSREGHQPMTSASGRYVIAFNGEIYNFRALRRDLEVRGHSLRGHSDTEVLLAAIEEWGVIPALERSNGMFAFALWDRQERTLRLARDRIGEKPLYYCWAGRTLLFGSELKALRAHPAFSADIDRGALAQFLRHKYVPAPRSIYRGVTKLPPGSVVSIDAAGRTSSPNAYWSVVDAAAAGLEDPFRDSIGDAADAMDECLRDAVRLRMEADVPLGAFLSGGIDSSTVVAMMQAQSDRPVRTFTIGVRQPGYDEAANAAEVARHLGTDHTELYVTAEEAMAVIPSLPEIYDEPFADSSQIPTLLVSKLARERVTVSLSGDGGDEVFGGYNRYAWGPAVWRRTGWLPTSVRRAGANGLRTLSPGSWERVFRAAGPLLPRRMRQRNPGEKLHKLAAALEADGVDETYRSLVSHWSNPDQVVLGSEEPPDGLGEGSSIADPTRRMMLLDTLTYLPDDILVKLDRATMAVSLEGRVPYLDHRVVEMAWRMPLPMHVSDGVGKRLLRRILHRYVPPALVERPKWGFGIPTGSWLRGPLRGWAEALLEPARLRREGLLDPGPIRAAWAEHLSGRRNRQYELWDVLMFQAWLEASDRDAVAA